MDTTTTNPAIAQAMASVAAAVHRAAMDPARPTWHFRPPANWMNDPNGPIYHNGYYHLFYQHNPYGDDWGHMHWGHARSRDLVHWEHLPIALWPSLEQGEEHIFSGCAHVNGDGQPMLLYTSVGKDRTGKPRANEQWAALGDPDWITWEKHPANPILALESHGGPPLEGDWRDPFIFEAGGRTFLVLGGNFGDSAAVMLYEAADATLTHWTYHKVLYSETRRQMQFCECPNFFAVGDLRSFDAGTGQKSVKWVLLLSPYRPVEYIVGDFDLASLTFTPQQMGILDPGYNDIAPANYYATNILFAPDGRCILLGWVRGFVAGRGWNGCLAVPRVLTIGPDNRPRQTPIAELASLRRAHHAVRDVHVAGVHMALDRLDRAAAEIQVTLDLGDAPRCGLRFEAADGEGNSLEIVYDRQTLLVAGVAAPLSLAPGAPLTLHLFLDGAVLEVFADGGRVAVTRAVDLPVGRITVEMLARAGNSYLLAYDRWELAG